MANNESTANRRYKHQFAFASDEPLIHAKQFSQWEKKCGRIKGTGHLNSTFKIHCKREKASTSTVPASAEATATLSCWLKKNFMERERERALVDFIKWLRVGKTRFENIVDWFFCNVFACWIKADGKQRASLHTHLRHQIPNHTIAHLVLLVELRKVTARPFVEDAAVSTQVRCSNLQSQSETSCVHLRTRMMPAVVPIEMHATMIESVDRLVHHGLGHLVFRLQVILTQHNLHIVNQSYEHTHAAIDHKMTAHGLWTLLAHVMLWSEWTFYFCQMMSHEREHAAFCLVRVRRRLN